MGTRRAPQLQTFGLTLPSSVRRGRWADKMIPDDPVTQSNVRGTVRVG